MIIAVNEHASPYYESIEFDVTTATTDYDVDSNQATFLSVIGPGSVYNKHPTEIIIRTNNTITVKFNTTGNHAITITASDSPLAWRGEVKNIFISNASGNTAAVKIIALP